MSFSPLLAREAVAQVYANRDSYRAPTVGNPLDGSAARNPFKLLGRGVDTLQSQTYADPDVGALRGSIAQIRGQVPREKATFVPDGDVPTDQASNVPSSVRRTLKPATTTDPSLLKLGVPEERQFCIIQKPTVIDEANPFESEVARKDGVTPLFDAIRGLRARAPAGDPSRFGTTSPQSSVYLDMQEYPAFDIVGLNAELALQEVLLYNHHHTARTMDQYYADMLRLRTPAAIWHENYFVDGVVHEIQPSGRPGRTVTGPLFGISTSGAGKSPQQGGDPARILSSVLLANVINHGQEDIYNYPMECGANEGARLSFIFKRYPITHETTYRILAAPQDYLYERTGHPGPIQQGLTNEFTPAIPKGVTLYALQLAVLAWSPGTYVPMDYLTYSVPHIDHPDQEPWERFDGISIDLGHIFFRARRAEANAIGRTMGTSLRPDELRPFTDNPALRSQMLPPLQLFISFNNVHN